MALRRMQRQGGIGGDATNVEGGLAPSPMLAAPQITLHSRTEKMTPTHTKTAPDKPSKDS